MVSLWNHISNPEELSDDHLSLLKDQIEAHPYASSFHAMLAKHAKHSNSAEAEELLRNAAIRVQDRTVLQAYMNSAAVEPKEEPVEKKSPPQKRKKENQSKSDSERIKELDEQLIAAALSTGAAIDLLQDDPDSQDFSIKADEKSTEEKASNEMGISKTSDTGNREANVSKVELPSKMNFSAWMTALSDDESKSEPVQDSKEESPIVREVHESIIDHFLEKEDEIVPKRAEFFSPARAAKASLEDNTEIVSETLARVYAAQGSFDKAISTYEKLSLLHPEKSSYFAALIQKLNNDK
ncbi:MAG: tetratricopeptide repeat protein [Salibacteraceae bacterium]